MTSAYEWFSIRITKMWSYAGIAAVGDGDGLAAGEGLGLGAEGVGDGLDVGEDDGVGDGDAAGRRGLGDGELATLPGLTDEDEAGSLMEFGDGDALAAATGAGDVALRAWVCDPHAQAINTIAAAHCSQTASHPPLRHREEG